jgi:NAD(P)-dependent dehydrogenase (short-subunit alcohol dehydrogenase family)
MPDLSQEAEGAIWENAGAQGTPMGRVGRPGSQAPSPSLPRDEASFVTGATLLVDGGYTAR